MASAISFNVINMCSLSVIRAGSPASSVTSFFLMRIFSRSFSRRIFLNCGLNVLLLFGIFDIHFIDNHLIAVNPLLTVLEDIAQYTYMLNIMFIFGCIYS